MNNQSQANSQYCRVCMEPINTGAKKCLKCESYQDWRRFFGMGQLVLTLVVALVSVLSTGIPFLISSLETEHSIVKTSFYRCDTRGVDIVASNLGNRPAVIRNGDFRLLLSGAAQAAIPVQVVPKSGNLDSPFLEAGKSRLFRVKRDLDLPFPARTSDGAACRYELTIHIIGFQQKEDAATIHCDCPTS